MLNKNVYRHNNNILQSSRITVKDQTVGLGSQTAFFCAHGHKHTLSPDLKSPDCKEKDLIDYEVNVKGILQEYMNGAAGSSLNTSGVLIDLLNARKLSRQFSWNQVLVGEKIHAMVVKEMDLALQIKLKATVIMEESEKYYEQ